MQPLIHSLSEWLKAVAVIPALQPGLNCKMYECPPGAFLPHRRQLPWRQPQELSAGEEPTAWPRPGATGRHLLPMGAGVR